MQRITTTIRKLYLLKLGVSVSVVLILSAQFIPVTSLWSLNQLQFLPDWTRHLSVVGALTAITLVFMPIGVRRTEQISLSLDNFLFSSGRKRQVILALVCGAFFLALRVDIHLLGDGYTVLSILSRGETYILQWTEPGAILAIRAVQTILGGFTEQTARLAFQIVSVFSGIVTIYNLQRIIVQLFQHTAARIFALVTFLGSGVLLLFMGYVEHYLLLWAAASVFFNLSIKTLRGDGHSLAVIVSFAVTCFMHLQALYFAPAVLYLLWEKISATRLRESLHRFRFHLLIGAALIGLAVLFWGYYTFLEFEAMFLPPFEGRPASPDYAVFSAKHLLDIFNEVLTILPGALVIATLLMVQHTRRPVDSILRFLLVASSGSLLFLLLIDPVLGMARDWDLFSLTLLPLSLTGLYLLRNNAKDQFVKILPSYIVISVLISGSNIAVNSSTVMAENRFRSLLGYYGAKERGGWVIFSNYLEKKGEVNRARMFINEMREQFPEDRSLRLFYRHLETGKFSKALTLAKDMAQSDPFRSDFLQALGNAFGKTGGLDSAKYYYEQAIKLRPYYSMLRNEYGQILIKSGEFSSALDALKRANSLNPGESAIWEGIGLTYQRLGFIDSTLLIADTLFQYDEHSPGGHLLKMIAALSKGDRETASYNFIDFKKYGSGRSDYNRILEYYGNLEQPVSGK